MCIGTNYKILMWDRFYKTQRVLFSANCIRFQIFRHGGILH